MEIRAISTIHDGGHYSCHSIAVEDFSDGGTVTIILVGDYCSNVGKDSVILRNDTLIILLDAVIVVLSLKSAMDPGSHDIHRIKNNFGTYYSIYPVGNNYIIYGELEVKMLDKAFREVWTYSTTDILINPDYHLNIDDKQISFTDWDGNHHQLDMDGHLLCYKKRELNVKEKQPGGCSRVRKNHGKIYPSIWALPMYLYIKQKQVWPRLPAVHHTCIHFHHPARHSCVNPYAFTNASSLRFSLHKGQSL